MGEVLGMDYGRRQNDMGWYCPKCFEINERLAHDTGPLECTACGHQVPVNGIPTKETEGDG